MGRPSAETGRLHLEADFIGFQAMICRAAIVNEIILHFGYTRSGAGVDAAHPKSSTVISL